MKKVYILGIVTGLLLSLVTVYAMYKYQATDIGYTPENSNFKVDNVEKAINELYKEITLTGPTYEAPNTGDTHKGIVYLDPTNLKKGCNVSDAISTSETDKGCMKWYVFKEDSNTYTMILDHTVRNVQWNTEGTNGTNVAYETSLVKPYVDELVTKIKWQVTPRLITAEEVINITGKENLNDWFCLDTNQSDWTNYCSKAKGTSKYAWLFDYTYGCTDYGCNYDENNTITLANNPSSKTYVAYYWTSTTYTATNYAVWCVLKGGYMSGCAANSWEGGIRPVITISKSIIK